jgi:Ca2+-binding RTX toxin-like protein
MADIPGNASTNATLPLGPDFTPAEFEQAGDSDWFKVSLKQGVNYAFSADIELEPPFPEDYVYLDFQLRNPSGKVVRTGGFADTYDGYQFGFEYRPAASGVYFLEAVGSSEPSDYGVRAARDAAPDRRTTAEIEVGETQDASAFFAGDIDTYRIDLVRGETYDFAAESDEGALTLAVLDGDGDVLVESGGTIEGFKASSTGRFFLRAADISDFRSYDYTISARLADGAPGPRVVRLTGGDDEFEEFDGPPRTVFGLGGDDDIFALSAGSIVEGSEGDDILAAPKEARGGPGGDWFQIVADVTNGGPGDDRIEFDPPSGKQVSGGTGRDTFVMLNGSSRADRDFLVDFRPGEDVISFDFLAIFAGQTSAEPWDFIGRQGFDDVRQVRYTKGGGETLIEADENGDGTADFFFEIPREVTLRRSDFRLGVPTGPGPDSFAGTPFADTVRGYAADDVLRGAGGIDRLFGDEGDDTLDGGAGRDELNDGVGNNTFLGGSGDDVVFGGEDDDEIFGDAGDDELRGSEGSDTVRGGDGRDTVLGGRDSDTLHGDAGADLIAGGGPDVSDDFRTPDQMSGGPGNDTFFFDGFYSAGTLDNAADIIEDFAQGDRIDVSEIDASQGGAGDQRFTFIGTQAFSGSRQLRVESGGGDTIVQGSTDLERSPEFEIVLSGNVALSAGSFVL